MALRPFPLTRERFLAYAIARAGDNPFKDVDDACIDEWCEWASDTFQSAIGDRVQLPLVKWDACCEGHAVMLAWRPILGARGYATNEGRDNEIVELAKKADEYLSRLRPGSGKSENPMVEGSPPNRPLDAVIFVSQPNSMATLLGTCGRRC